MIVDPIPELLIEQPPDPGVETIPDEPTATVEDFAEDLQVPHRELLQALSAAGIAPITDGRRVWRWYPENGVWEPIPYGKLDRIIGLQDAQPRVVRLLLDAQRTFPERQLGMAFADSFVRASDPPVVTPHQPINYAKHASPLPYNPDPPQRWLTGLRSLIRQSPDSTIRWLQQHLARAVLEANKGSVLIIQSNASVLRDLHTALTVSLPTVGIAPTRWNTDWHMLTLAPINLTRLINQQIRFTRHWHYRVGLCAHIFLCTDPPAFVTDPSGRDFHVLRLPTKRGDRSLMGAENITSWVMEGNPFGPDRSEPPTVSKWRKALFAQWTSADRFMRLCCSRWQPVGSDPNGTPLPEAIRQYRRFCQVREWTTINNTEFQHVAKEHGHAPVLIGNETWLPFWINTRFRNMG